MIELSIPKKYSRIINNNTNSYINCKELLVVRIHLASCKHIAPELVLWNNLATASDIPGFDLELDLYILNGPNSQSSGQLPVLSDVENFVFKNFLLIQLYTS